MTFYNLARVALAAVAIAATFGCSRMGPIAATGQPAGTAGVTMPAPTRTPASTAIAAAQLSSSDVVAFLDPAADAQLTGKERAEAASAQYFALQFGRPGAPRVWQGDSGASGRVTVGPYVRVNQRDCREFTHEVSTKGATFQRSGTACRETDNRWSVVQLS